MFEASRMQAAEAEYRQARNLLEVVRAVERDATRLYQIALEQLGSAIRDQVRDSAND